MFEDILEKSRDKKCLILPPIKINPCQRLVPWSAYYMIMSEVPKGKVVIEDDVTALMEKLYGGAFEFEADNNRVSLFSSHAFPYWRMISKKGHLINIRCVMDKLQQKELLEGDGLVIKKIGESESYIVENYKERLFDLNQLCITVMYSEEEIRKAKAKLSC